MKRLDVIGHVYGRLTVIADDKPRGIHRHVRCRCACGTYGSYALTCLRTGNTQSCGCYQRERTSEVSVRHGHSSMGKCSPTYAAWRAARGRCVSVTNAAYARYGGRGITMCARWRDDFAAFLADMGARPSAWYSLDRIDNDGPYAPENCRWATRRQQNNNQRTNIHMTWQGQTMTLAQWAHHLGVSPKRLYHRLNRGWSVERTLSE